MKKLLLFLGLFLLLLIIYVVMNIFKIDLFFWFIGMNNLEFQLMVYGEGIGQVFVLVNYFGVLFSSVVKLESNNYLFVYLYFDKEVKLGKMFIIFMVGKKKLVKEYELKVCSKVGVDYKGFDVLDVLYLLMLDCFVNGNLDNDWIEGMVEYKVDCNDLNVCYGGDLVGIE